MFARTEATDSLNLGDEMGELDERLSVVTRKRRELTRQLKALKEKKQDHSEAVDQIDDDIEVWEGLAAKLDDGKTVYAPSLTSKPSKKRKRHAKQASGGRRKRRSLIDSDSDDIEYVESDDDENEDDASEEDVGSPQAARTPLTSEEIDDKLDDLKKLKKEARRAKTDLDDQVKDVRKVDAATGRGGGRN